MRFGPRWWAAGVAALLLTAGCKEGRLLTAQEREREQAAAAQAVGQAPERIESARGPAEAARQEWGEPRQEAARTQEGTRAQEMAEALAQSPAEPRQAQLPEEQAWQQAQEGWPPVQEAEPGEWEAQRQQKDELAQQEESLGPQPEEVAQPEEPQGPQPEALAQQEESLGPQPEEVAQQEEPLGPQPEALAQQEESLGTQPEALAQQEELLGPQPEALAQSPGVAAAAPQAQEEQLIMGEVLAANEREVLVSHRGEPQLLLQVRPGTVVIVDGRPARALDIQEGSQVRASYRDMGGEPTAVHIEVVSPREPVAPAPPESGESQPGAQPAPPFQED
jgi:colicin import membrane protein